MASALMRWLRPSVLEGAWLLKQQCRAAPDLEVPTVVRQLRATYAWSGFDFEVATQVMARIAPVETRSAFYRAALSLIFEEVRPTVLLLLMRGRESFCEALDLDAQECFRRTGALETPPSLETLFWLDQLASLARLESDILKMARGREAERKSLAWEACRLETIPNAPPPAWVALDDVGAGYDIRSVALENSAQNAFAVRLIEVKYSQGAKPEFYLSRNEIRVARLHSAYYVLHIWGPHSASPLVICWPDLDSQIPADTDLAQCTEVRIRWPSW
jgi:hypothetical protein